MFQKYPTPWRVETVVGYNAWYVRASATPGHPFGLIVAECDDPIAAEYVAALPAMYNVCAALSNDPAGLAGLQP